MIQTIEIVELDSKHCQELLALRKEFPGILFRVNVSEMNLADFKSIFMSSNDKIKMNP
jgi:hypothetical protein